MERMDDDREELKRVLREWIDAEQDVRELIGVGQILVPGEPPEPTVLTADMLAEWDAAVARRDAAYRTYREAMQLFSEGR